MPTKKTSSPKKKELDILKRINRHAVLDLSSFQGDVDLYLNKDMIFSTCIWDEKAKTSALKEVEALIDALLLAKEYVANYDYSMKSDKIAYLD